MQYGTGPWSLHYMPHLSSSLVSGLESDGEETVYVVLYNCWHIHIREGVYMCVNVANIQNLMHNIMLETLTLG